MKFIVTDRETIEAGLPVKEPYIVISIRDPGRAKARIHQPGHCRGILHLAFHDTEPTRGFVLPANVHPMTATDAEVIVRFFREHERDISTVVVHCHQGMSRSPGVAKALAHATGNDAAYFDRHYQPNAHAFRLVVKAMRTQYRSRGTEGSRSMSNTIPQPPTSFCLISIAGRWFLWSDINSCFWPASRRKPDPAHAALCEAKGLGGIYLLAWSHSQPKTTHPSDPAVMYVGETNLFRRRMANFGTSAGLWGKRANGHSAGWRWPLGKHTHLWVAFFDVGSGLQPHIATGLRHWMEGLAQEEYRLVHGALPPLNRVADGEIELADFATDLPMAAS